MNTRIKCLLLEDELPGLTYLKMLCEQIPELEVIKAFNNPKIFLKEVPNLDFDLCIMDIEMPEMNGLEVANLLHGKPVIFTTAYKEYAAEAYDINAVDYVRKPVKMERLQQAISKAKIRLNTTKEAKDFIQLNTNKGKALIFFDQVCYIKVSEVDSRDKIIQFFDGSEITLKNISFDKLLTILPKSHFVRINKKEIIALKTVKVFSFYEIITNIQLRSGQNLKLILSETYRSEFMQKVKI